MRENKIEAYLKSEAKRLGGETRKVSWIGKSNAPDELVLLPGHSFFAEIKRDDLPGEFPRDAHERAQHREHERMRAAGIAVYVLQSKNDIDWALKYAMEGGDLGR